MLVRGHAPRLAWQRVTLFFALWLAPVVRVLARDSARSHQSRDAHCRAGTAATRGPGGR